MRRTTRRAAITLAVTALGAGAVLAAPTAAADNKRLNESIVANVHTVMMRAGCADDYDIEPMVRVNPKLRLAAQWHANDVLHNRALDGDIGSDGSTVADRARAAGYEGEVAETVAINPALSINAVEVMNQWWYRPDYHATMAHCGNMHIGVWSENSLDRSVLVAVYGRGDGAEPAAVPPRQFG
ncbi:CAP domain-containing protein [[Mycobacterium] wendilense]|uniref:CAP domain-containing protein n=1 Tax=[Mycobacterium] wendilense TaxID=3064284 RepID=A0ABM9MCA3_9MYCO|nr:CAP domain-containing protein [Mycolicibacterium sp. MU0050]CAJ1581726.1 CAP domain-containing protein [Mycolicibacterium sp. MU0050]